MLYPIVTWLLRSIAAGCGLTAIITLMFDHFVRDAAVAPLLMLLVIIPAGVVVSCVSGVIEWGLGRVVPLPHSKSLDGVRAALRGTICWDSLGNSLSEDGIPQNDWAASWRHIRHIIEVLPSYRWVEFHKFSYCIYRDLSTLLLLTFVAIVSVPSLRDPLLGVVLFGLSILAILRMHRESVRHVQEAVLIYLSQTIRIHPDRREVNGGAP